MLSVFFSVCFFYTRLPSVSLTTWCFVFFSCFSHINKTLTSDPTVPFRSVLHPNPCQMPHYFAKLITFRRYMHAHTIHDMLHTLPYFMYVFVALCLFFLFPFFHVLLLGSCSHRNNHCNIASSVIMLHIHSHAFETWPHTNALCKWPVMACHIVPTKCMCHGPDTILIFKCLLKHFATLRFHSLTFSLGLSLSHSRSHIRIPSISAGARCEHTRFSTWINFKHDGRTHENKKVFHHTLHAVYEHVKTSGVCVCIAKYIRMLNNETDTGTRICHKSVPLNKAQKNNNDEHA